MMFRKQMCDGCHINQLQHHIELFYSGFSNEYVTTWVWPTYEVATLDETEKFKIEEDFNLVWIFSVWTHFTIL